MNERGRIKGVTERRGEEREWRENYERGVGSEDDRGKDEVRR